MAGTTLSLLLMPLGSGKAVKQPFYLAYHGSVDKDTYVENHESNQKAPFMEYPEKVGREFFFPRTIPTS